MTGYIVFDKDASHLTILTFFLNLRMFDQWKAGWEGGCNVLG